VFLGGVLIIPHRWDAAKSGWVELDSDSVTKKKRKKTFRAVTAVKALARERIGAPPPEQVVPDLKKKRKSSEKHKPTLGQLLQTGE
jgi:hypothetical protein